MSKPISRPQKFSLTSYMKVVFFFYLASDLQVNSAWRNLLTWSHNWYYPKRDHVSSPPLSCFHPITHHDNPFVISSFPPNPVKVRKANK